MHRRSAWFVVLLPCLLVGSACSGSAPSTSTSTSTVPGSDSTGGVPAAASPTSTVAVGPASEPVSFEVVEVARRQLDSLAVAARPRPDGTYERDAFGGRWRDVDGNGCNQRDDVLLRDAVPGTVTVERQGACAHDVVAGTWVDPYTGATLVFEDLKDQAQAQAIQIDHVVPLAEAWMSGASEWTDDRREAFANDLAGLLAVDGPTNASKGSDDPAAWRPRQAFQCQYAIRWIETKARWDLAVDASERRALHDLLDRC